MTVLKLVIANSFTCKLFFCFVFFTAMQPRELEEERFIEAQEDWEELAWEEQDLVDWDWEEPEGITLLPKLRNMVIMGWILVSFFFEGTDTKYQINDKRNI